MASETKMKNMTTTTTMTGSVTEPSTSVENASQPAESPSSSPADENSRAQPNVLMEDRPHRTMCSQVANRALEYGSSENRNAKTHGPAHKVSGRKNNGRMQAASTGRNILLIKDSLRKNDLRESTSSSASTASDPPWMAADTPKVCTSGVSSQYRAKPWATDPITVSREGFQVICSLSSDSAASTAGRSSINEKRT